MDSVYVHGARGRTGHREDTLRRADGSWLICQRTIHLAANVRPAKNLSLFL